MWDPREHLDLQTGKRELNSSLEKSLYTNLSFCIILADTLLVHSYQEK